MSGTIHIVTTCTDRKKVPVTDDRRLREVASGLPIVRARSWWNRLQESPDEEGTRARDLYAGEHWTVALQLPAALDADHGEPELWVASAGYGLVGWDAPLKSYSATFAAGLEDSVISNLSTGGSRAPLLRDWWRTLSLCDGPLAGAPRKIAQIAADDQAAAILVVASPDYVLAMQEDLLATRDLLNHPDQLVVISNRAKLQSGPLADHLVPVDHRARTVVGGTMQGLNARVALALFRQLGSAQLDAGSLQDLYAAMTRDAKPPKRPKGEPMTDDQVVSFITEQLAEDSTVKQTRLLRKLRDSGRSCEQARFRGLYKRTTGQSS